MIATLAIPAVTLLVVLAAAGGIIGAGSVSGDPSDFIGATTNQALRSIRNADESGADVSRLIDRFNAAIELQEQAENGRYKDCPSYNECVLKANDMLLSIVDEASSLSTQVTGKKEQASVIMFTVYIPIASFIGSVSIVVGYRAWKSWRARRFEKLEIHERSAQ
jgi:hypothetical protein